MRAGRTPSGTSAAMADGETSVEVVTSGELGGKVVFPDERGPEAFGIASRETFLLRGRTLADFINKTKTEKWKALAELLGLDAIELLRQDLQRARTDIKKQVKAAEEKIAASRRAISSGDAAVSEEGVLDTLQQICRGLGVDVPESLVDGRRSAPGSPPSPERAPAWPHRSWRCCPRPPRAFATPSSDESAIRAWNAIVSSQGGKDLSC